MFRTGARNRFHAPNKKKPRCSKLKVGNDLVTDKENLLHIWASYFTELSKSKIIESEDLQLLSNKVKSGKAAASLANEEHLHVLDTPFIIEELVQALSKLKMRKASGPDGFCAEHLKFGGQALFTWLLKILNSIIELEAIPLPSSVVPSLRSTKWEEKTPSTKTATEALLLHLSWQKFWSLSSWGDGF